MCIYYDNPNTTTSSADTARLNLLCIDQSSSGGKNTARLEGRRIVSMERNEKPLRVAVVGTGMAGLMAAYLLDQDAQRRYEVVVFESVSSTSTSSPTAILTSIRARHSPWIRHLSVFATLRATLLASMCR